MTPREFALYQSIQRRASKLTPELAKELLAAYRTIRESLSDAELARLIAEGRLDEIVDQALLDKSFLPLKEKLQDALKHGMEATVKQLPKPAQAGVMFDVLSPKVIDAVRQLDSRVIKSLQDDVKDVVRAYVENGLRDGKSPREAARQLRSVIGIAPSQEANAQKYEQKLRDAGESETRIEKKLATYRRKAVNNNAATVARTAAIDSQKLGNRLSWDEAANKGLVDRALMDKTWRGVMDSRERPEHVAMQGQKVPFDQPFSNGQMVPGDTEYNCRCIEVITLRKPAA